MLTTHSRKLYWRVGSPSICCKSFRFQQKLGENFVDVPPNESQLFCVRVSVGLNGPHRKLGRPTTAGDGVPNAHGGVAAVVTDYDMANFGHYNAAAGPPTPLPTQYSVTSQSAMMDVGVGLPPPPQMPSRDAPKLKISTQMSLSFEQNCEMFGDLRQSAAYAPSFGFDTAQHLSNMETWQRDALRHIWPDVDALFAKASRLYKNTRKPDQIEKFASWLTRHVCWEFGSGVVLPF